MMTAVPVLMVLYSSDATEIRYSDGSCLELSPCGSTMIYHERPKLGEHPKHGESRKIQKRTRFVTSEYRPKVIQALDFRNRFAERSYLCEELIGRESIVDLYAKVDDIVWPPRPEDIQIEQLPDGSRRITSLDEFATLVLSPHRHDFSISFLARVARDKIQKQDLCGQKQVLTSDINSSSKSFQPNREVKASPELTENVVYALIATNRQLKHQYVKFKESCDNINGLIITSRDANHQSRQTNIATPVKSTDIILGSNHKSISIEQSSNDNTEKVMDEAGKDVYHCKTDIPKSSNSLHVPEDHSQSRQLDEDISQSNLNTPSNKSALVVGSELPPRFSDGAHDISSISRSSTPDGLRALVDADSTLVQDETVQDCQQRVTALMNRHNLHSQFTSSPNDVLCGVVSKQVERVSCNLDISLSGSYTENNNFSNKQRQRNCESDNKLQKQSVNVLDDNLSSSAPSELCRVGPLHKVDLNLTEKTEPKDTRDMLNFVDPLATVPHAGAKMESCSDTVKVTDLLNNIVCQTDDSATKIRPMANLASEPCSNETIKASQGGGYGGDQYVWTTRHCSRNDCPAGWAHPLMLALEGQCFSESFVREKNIITKVLPTLPVTCPFQHNHKWSPGRNEVGEAESLVGSAGEFQHGMLKLVISEGVVYRLIRKPGINIVEIYPGDDSVLVSHGAKGHFFTHYVSVSGQIEERTYSIKSMPCRQQNGKYSINKIISTAKRFLTINEVWAHRGLKEEIPCWKREVIAVIEPLASSLLEECTVEGLGKFSAFTNGRVRIVFDDRASLDMVCNFSHRIQDRLQDKLDTQVSLPGANSVSPPMSTYESIFGSRTGRLMLPSGKFVTVNINKPGPYRRYVEVGQEWAAWVCSSPAERHMFYTQLYAPAVLQKAAEIELKKIFCFNYVLEQTMNAQLQLKIPERVDIEAESSRSHAAEARKKVRTSSVTNLCHPAVSTSLVPISDDRNRAHSHFASDHQFSETSLGHTSIEIFPPNSNHDALVIDANRGSVHGGGTLDWPAKTGYTVNEENNLGFEQVMAVLLQNSLMISDIDAFLDNAKKSGPFEKCGS